MIIPVSIMTAIGLLAGICLAIASLFFHVEKDWRLDGVRRCLSGANCGACGYPGCDALASAIVKGEAPVNACPGADEAQVKKIAAIMGVAAAASQNRIAIVLCNGGKNACDTYKYSGVEDCLSISMLAGGIKQCQFGCLGAGSCIKECKFNALKINDNGVAEVITERCTGCGLCVPACPRKLIVLKDKRASSVVLCSSKEKGVETKKSCSVGCIGCGLCAKVCASSAITVANFLASIDSTKCTNCGECIKKCPSGAIQGSKQD